MGRLRSKKDNGRQARLTAPPKPGVFSYYSNQTRAAEPVVRPDGKNKPTYARTPFWQHTWVRNFPSLVALAAVTVSVLYCLGLSSNPKVVVSAHSPQTNIIRDRSEYQQGAQRLLQQSVLNRTKFTINTGAFEKSFRTEFPEIAEVSVALPLVSRRPVVTISTAQPKLIMTAQSKAYVLDSRGTVIMLAGDLNASTRASLPVVNDQSGIQVSVGKTVLASNDVAFITEVAHQFSAKGLKIETISLPTAAHEVDFKLVGQPYYIKTSIDTQAREAAGSFLAVKQKLDQSRTVPAQYVDVRIAGRAYYQ